MTDQLFAETESRPPLIFAPGKHVYAVSAPPIPPEHPMWKAESIYGTTQLVPDQYKVLHSFCVAFVCVGEYNQLDNSQLWLYDSTDERKYSGSMWAIHHNVVDGETRLWMKEVTIFSSDVILTDIPAWVALFDNTIPLDHVLDVTSIDAEELLDFGKKVRLFQTKINDTEFTSTSIAFSSNRDKMEYVLRYGEGSAAYSRA